MKGRSGWPGPRLDLQSYDGSSAARKAGRAKHVRTGPEQQGVRGVGRNAAAGVPLRADREPPLTVACVPTVMKTGVSTPPCKVGDPAVRA